MIPAPGLADRLAVDVQGIQALRAGAARNDPEVMRTAARQFEAMMLQTLLKSVRETHFTTEDDPFAPSESLKLYRDLLDQQWVQKMTEAGGLGFADMLVKHMLGQALPPGAARQTAPGGLQGGSCAACNGEPQAGMAGATSGRADAAAPPPAEVESATEASNRKLRFLQTMRPHAEAAARVTGIPADFILAHAALESGWGTREIRDANGRDSHNLFGIKAGRGWKGESMESLTTEYHSGLPVKVSERFRAYDDYTQAFSDYGALLERRYKGALQAGTDAHAFTQALASAGYASDPAYAVKLRSVIASVARAGA